MKRKRAEWYVKDKVKRARQKEISQKIPGILVYFSNAELFDAKKNPARECVSAFATKNNVKRHVKQSLHQKKNESKARKTSTKGHRQHSGGAVKKRGRKLSRRGRNAHNTKVGRVPKLKKKPKLAHLVITVRDRLDSLRRRIRSCSRCSLGQSILLKQMHTILMEMLDNTFDTLDGPCTVSHNQAAEVIHNFHPGWRVLQHTKKFLCCGKLPVSNRGGKREGHTLLDEEVFRSKASLWVKTQIALHTKRRLRAIRKKGSVDFKSQSELPMEEKQTANVTSHTFQQFIENTLLAEFYSEEAVRCRAKSAATAEGTLRIRGI